MNQIIFTTTSGGHKSVKKENNNCRTTRFGNVKLFFGFLKNIFKLNTNYTYRKAIELYVYEMNDEGDIPGNPFCHFQLPTKI